MSTLRPLPNTASRIGLPPFPTGWYALCFSSELRRGAAIRGVWLGRHLEVRRNDSGAVEVRELGHPWPVLEQDDAVFTWYDAADREPMWQLPRLDPTGWTAYAGHVWPNLATHPQETSENSVDIAHFSRVHGYRDVETIQAATMEGPVLTATYAFTRDALPYGFTTAPVRATFTVRVVGLGYSIVENHVPQYGMSTRQLILATPTDGDHIALRIAGAVAHFALPPPLDRTVAWGARLGLIRAFVQDVGQDLEIWQRKRYLDRPRIVSGDGPIGRYRRWCRQFYPNIQEAAS